MMKTCPRSVSESGTHHITKPIPVIDCLQVVFKETEEQATEKLHLDFWIVKVVKWCVNVQLQTQ